VRLSLKHAGTRTTTTVTTVPNPEDTSRSAIKVTVAPSYDFPFQVGIHLDPNIGGPSAGMMFALGIYDLLTPGSLTHGKVVAGTGEITPAGKVGEIGGIQQKLVGAQDAGAKLFLVPAGNCAEALGGHYDSAKMRLVRVQTLSDAIKDVKAWTANPHAKLPGCTR
jgi:PDZ domain-containing protein